MTLFQFTPLREGRLAYRKRINSTKNFNSRPSARGDVISVCVRCGVDLFQFTPLREGRRDAHERGLVQGYFNSRPSARGDGKDCVLFRLQRISIHAPPRGATEQWRCK